jgi:hypothetical protein
MGGTFHRPLRPRPVCRACQEAGHEATSLKPVLVGDRSLQLRLKETQGQGERLACRFLALASADLGSQVQVWKSGC